MRASILAWGVFIAFVPALGRAETIDLTNMSELAAYEVSFCARPSPDTVKRLPGHAFVAFSQATSGRRDFTAIGHTIPAGSEMAAAWSYFGVPTTGLLAEEIYTDALQ